MPPKGVIVSNFFEGCRGGQSPISLHKSVRVLEDTYSNNTIVLGAKKRAFKSLLHLAHFSTVELAQFSRKEYSSD